MEAGGLDTTGHPIDAKDYGPFLQQHGYHSVPGATYTGEEQMGDIVVFQPAPGHSAAGHIEMWDGSRWVSDTKQRGLFPYGDVSESLQHFTIYRR